MNIKLEKLIYTLFIISILTLTEAQSGKKKNVLLIVGDDLGWSDFGFFDPSIQTPNIDRLVKTGILLNNTYTSAVCTPSRNSILSGVYPEHTGLQHDVIMPEQPVGLPTSFKLLPKYFKENGYKTHMIGKWHLGFCKKEYTPVARGFDTFYGYFNAQEDYYSHRVSSLLVLKTQDGLDFWNQTEDYIVPVLNKNNTYSMFTYRDRAFDILEKHDKNDPFFMYFSSQNCHLPNQVPKEYEDRYSFIKDDDRRKYLGMVTLLDDVIGNLTTKLDDLGLLENTLIFFISDNGGAVYSSGRNYPLRGGKLSAFEGGHRVRAFVNGPGLKPNTYNGLFHSTDLLPTILNAAISEGIQISGIDGINQWPNIVNDQESNRTSFIYIIDPLGYAGCDFIFKSDAIREGDWKLILGCPGIYDQWYPEPTFDETFVRNYYSKKLVKNRNVNKIPHGTYLFNIKDDPLEKNNLADVHKDIVKDLTNKLDSYKKKVVYPVNPPTLLPDPRANPKHWHDTWSPGWC